MLCKSRRFSTSSDVHGDSTLRESASGRVRLGWCVGPKTVLNLISFRTGSGRQTGEKTIGHGCGHARDYRRILHAYELLQFFVHFKRLNNTIYCRYTHAFNIYVKKYLNYCGLYKAEIHLNYYLVYYVHVR